MSNPTFRMQKSLLSLRRFDLPGEKGTLKIFLGFSLVTH